MDKIFNTRRVLNFFDSDVNKKVNISADQVPTLIPENTLKEWQKNDDNPYYKIQVINYPVIANDKTYEESFFESYINKLKERPFPGSKFGHEYNWGKRDTTDFILIGGKVEKQGNGTGQVYFKNYIPPTGASGSNETFIKENKTDMIHYSLVAYVREIREDDGENVSYRIVESMRGERNDAVGYGEGAMDQVTNANDQFEVLEDSISNCKKLIKSGKIDLDSAWNETDIFYNNANECKKWHLVENKNENSKDKYSFAYGKNGIVFRSALRSIQSRSSQQDNKVINQIASGLLDQLKNTNRSFNMDKKELLETAKNLCENGMLTISEIANAMGIENKVINSEHTQALVLSNALKEAKIADPIAEIKRLNDIISESEDMVRNALLTEKFGNPGTEEIPNLLRTYAEGRVTNLSGEKLKNAIEALKDDPIAKNFSKESADYLSNANVIGKKERSTSTNSVETVDY